MIIGQVEPGRAGDPDKDLPQYYHSQTNPFQVYAGSGVDGANSALVQGAIGAHATEVAGVMIAKGTPITLYEGVAPDAILHSNGDSGAGGDEVFAVALDRLATISGMRAINISEGRLAQEFIEAPDGNTLITEIVDWTAYRYDVLNVVAGAEDAGPAVLPQDNFNGITVAASWRVRNPETNQPEGHFRQVAPYNVFDPDADAVGDRTSIDIIAPGDQILLTSSNELGRVRDGTSFAAPHVTGTAALLHQFASTQVTNSVPRWDDNNAHRHEVMKAIILNSADKLNGVHGSSRDVINGAGQLWTQTTAGTSETVALDEQMGAGHLNAGSALINFQPGEYDPGTVPKIGWDYGTVGAFGGTQDYVFDQQVSGYVAITLAWDRQLVLTDPDDDYTSGDQFFGSDINDLDIYLLPSNTDNLNLAVDRSVTFDDNLEHIFFNAPAGSYKIKVVNNGGLGEAQDYGLAWWAGSKKPGDFDGDGDVDGDDLGQWKGDFGQNGDSDADGDGDSDGADFLAWQQNLGMTAATPTAAAVPEPSAWMLCAVCLPLLRRRLTSQ